MSRNRESWLLSLALPHIPFLSSLKSFPFTFPPSLSFGGEKNKPLHLQRPQNLLWPVTVQNTAATRHPASRSHAARTNPSTAWHFLRLHFEKQSLSAAGATEHLLHKPYPGLFRSSATTLSS